MKCVFFSAVSYDSIISGRTKLLALELSRLGHDVWFVEMPGLRNVRIPPCRLKRRDGVTVVTLLPFPGSYRLMDSFAGTLWRTVAAAFLRKFLPFMEACHCIVSNPWWAPLVTVLPFRTVNYDCIDHVSVHCGPEHVQRMKGWEARLIGHCRNIFVIRSRLIHELEDSGRAAVHLIPNGVPGSWLSFPMASSVESEGTRPVIGFVGSIYEWIDQDLILHAAAALKDAQFILAGPVRREVPINRLARVPNIIIHPPVPFERVPGLIRSFDVCLIPFKRDIVSHCADPLKLYEYLALGKPVVSSIAFDAGAPIYLGPTPDEFVKCIEQALREKHSNVEGRRVFATGYTWRRQAVKMIEAMS